MLWDSMKHCFSRFPPEKLPQLRTVLYRKEDEMRGLRLKEPPLIINPKLAALIGLNEAIILQQIHYWIENNRLKNTNFKDCFYWTYNSFESWQEQFPFWNVRTIRRIIDKLRQKELVIVGNYNQMKIDRTLWYRLDYGKIESLLEGQKVKLS